MIFLLTDIALDITQVFNFVLVLLCYFSGVYLSGWITLFLASLVALVLLENLGLGLTLRMTCISRRSNMVELSFIVLMILAKFILFDKPITLWALSVNFLCF